MTTHNKKNKKIVKLFWILVIAPIIFTATIFILISIGAMGFMPSFEDLENPKSNLASEIYSSDQILFGKYYYQNRTYVNFDDLSPYLVKALIATEDYRFTQHSGIDAKAMFRVAYGVLSSNLKGGGSTISQQLSKNLFPRDTTTYNSKMQKISHLVLSKLKEWVTAVKLERNYTKEEILSMYLNTVTFGSQSFGIKSACSTFFNKTPANVEMEQAALMIGVLKAPSYYSPVRHPERALQRRNTVLKQMKKYNFISQNIYDSISGTPLNLDYKVQNHTQGLATYFREYLRMALSSKKPDLNNYWSYKKFAEDSIEWETNPLFGWCNKNFKPDGTNFNLYKDGLKIYTTINSKMQKYAEEAVNEHLSKDLQLTFEKEMKQNKTAPFSKDLTHEETEHILFLSMKRSERYRILKNNGYSIDSIKIIFDIPTPMEVFSWQGEIDTTMTPMDSIIYYKHYLQAGFMSMEPSSGYVRAYVGGINYKHFQFDHVKLSRRQVGSTFKPFLYTLAMQEGYSPCYEVPNVPTTFVLPSGDTWTPRNSGNSKYDRKMVTLKWGLTNSVNNVSAWLMKQFKPRAVINITKLMGIKSYIPPVPSICLGTADISLYEMIGAYGTFANKGVYTEPIFVSRIEDKNGNILQTFQANKTEAISKNTAFLMLNLMESVVQHGTSIRLRFKYNLMNEIAAKTGTTNNQSDGWFMGITPNLVSGVWVGGEERSIHFDGIHYGQGANMALPIWALYMQKIYADSLGVSIDDKFEKPVGFSTDLDCDENNQNNFIENENKNDNEFFN
ncbi:MAG: transglycosylase domain-containing protein [Bacteroidetes bacterium]|nr:transglycosylase domain-containing protein [Bacteroidota bacterium]